MKIAGFDYIVYLVDCSSERIRDKGSIFVAAREVGGVY